MKKVTIMREEYESLKASSTALKELKEHTAHLEQQVKYLMEQMRLSRHRQFGSSSEKSEYDASQMNLFNEAEVFAQPDAKEPEIIKVTSHKRTKQMEGQQRLPDDLPVEEIEHVLPEDEQSCPACSEHLHIMGKKVVREELKLIPAKAVIVRHIQYTYACRHCEKHEETVPIVKAQLPNLVIKGSFATPEAVAHIMAQKFVMSIPMYRQEQEWKRQGIRLSRQTMSNWLLRCSKDWLESIYQRLHQQLLTHQVLHADETTLQVLQEPSKSAQSKSYMWLYRTGGDAENAIVLYEYQPDRKKERPKNFLEGFSGYLHTDGYAAYHSLPGNITAVGCLAHARRKFDEALKILPKEERAGSLSQKGKQYCDKLFAFEREFADADLSSEERYIQRQEQSKPVLEVFLAWLKSLNTGKNPLGRAVKYTLDQWKYLTRYLEDGRLEISNNRAERSIKPFVIGRKNFLFANTPEGAKSSAMIYSIVETAKENGLDPYRYLVWLFREMPNCPQERWDNFLPGGSGVPEDCHCPKPKPKHYAWEEYK